MAEEFYIPKDVIPEMSEQGNIELTNNTIFAMKSALVLGVGDARNEPPCTATISHNRFNSGTPESPIIVCRQKTDVITSDGTNILLNPNRVISCEGLPSKPGLNPF